MLHARHFLAGILAAATGMALYFRAPFPDANLFVHVMVIRAASAYVFFKDSYTLFLYTTPYIVYSVLLAALYIFALKATCKTQAGKLTLYPDPAKRTELSLIVGELHLRARKCHQKRRTGWSFQNAGFLQASPG
jgi:hypothetical protein